MSGVIIANAILLGLADRARTGEGALVQSSMLQAMLWWLWSDMIGQRTFVLFDDVPMHYRNPSTEAVFETSDGGYVAAWAMSDADWRALATAVERDDWITNPDFALAENRNARIDEMVELIRDEVAKHPYGPLTEKLRASDAVWAPANQPESLLRDEQVLANEMYVEIEHEPQGTIRQPPLPFRVNGVSTPVLRTPQLGQHTEEILHELGYSEAAIGSLIAENVVRTSRQ
jgi:crotonobetainyl-CoA:carnitine CoA-transferase CaiB-like acyl-CoA transferase